MSQTNNISIIPGQFPQTFYVSQNDVGRVLAARLSDESGDYSVSGSEVVTLAGTKPSGLGFTVTGTVDGTDASLVTFVTTSEMTDEYGRFPVEIKLTNETDGTLIGSANAYLDVGKDPHPDGTTDGSAEALVNTLTALVQRVEAVTDRVDEIEAAAEAAAESEANAEEYAENAASSANSAADSAASAEEDAETASEAANDAEESATSAAASALAAAQVLSQYGDIVFSINSEDNGIDITVTTA